MENLFRQISERVSRMVGSVWVALLVIAVIAGSGYYYQFDSAWKVNTGLAGTIFALLLLIVLQKSQNHGDKATHVKLDELIRAVEGARTEVLDAENQPAAELERLKKDLADKRAEKL